MKAFRITLGLIVAALSICAAELASAQTMVGQSVRNVAGTIWSGVEDMGNKVGELGFGFRGDGKCVMVDRSTAKTNRPIEGTWQQNGSDVTIRFQNCEYTGKLNGNVLSGTASFFENPNARWNFAVKLAPK